MKIVITGADGFVGKHATRVFRERGHEVVELVGGSAHEGARVFDLRDAGSARSALEGTNATHVLHLAGASSVARSHENPSEAFAVNTLGTVHVLDAVRHTIPQARVVVVSSGEVYGKLDHPAREDDPTNPTSPYAASKRAAEIAAEQFHESYGLSVVIARPFNHLGPGQAPHFVVPSFARQIQEIKAAGGMGEMKVGNLEAVRDFSHVLDVVDAYEILLERGESGAIYNVAVGIGRSVRSLLDELLAIAGVRITPRVDPARVRPVELPTLIGTATRLRDAGWTAHRSVHLALAQVLEEVNDT